MHRVTPAEAQEIFLSASTFIQAIDEAIDEADALITTVADSVEWSSFSSSQRASLSQWHGGVREARLALGPRK